MAIACVLAAFVSACSGASNAAAPAPPGRLIDVGGWRLHVNCTGPQHSGAPTVILEAGSGDFSFDWYLVQSAVQDFARVCSYDRAGNAWSNLGPRPRTMAQIAYELHTVLDKGDIRPPYVMVGHSSGALLAREFTRTYASEVAGLILVDGTHEDIRLNIRGELRRVRSDATGNAIPAVQKQLASEQQALSSEETANASMMIGFAGAPAIAAPYDRLPPEAEHWRLWALAQTAHYVADDDPYWPDELQAIYAARQESPAPLGALPLIVISRELDRSEEIEAGAELNAERRAWQKDLTQLSSAGRLVVAVGSGHHIQLEKPHVVVGAIRDILEEIEAAAPPDTP